MRVRGIGLLFDVVWDLFFGVWGMPGLWVLLFALMCWVLWNVVLCKLVKMAVRY